MLVFQEGGKPEYPDKTLRARREPAKSKSSLRSDEGLTLETSAFESLYGGQFTLSTQLMKPN